jgi:hypothetical protein
MDKDYMIDQLKQQIKFEQFVNSFYLDLLVNHGIHEDNYYNLILGIIKKCKDESLDAKELNTNLKNIPGQIHEKIKSGELKEILNL